MIENRKEKKFREFLEKKHESALKNLLENQDFRFYIAELLGFCKTFENAFSEKGNVASFNNGLQAAGQKIFNDIMAVAPHKYITICEEEKNLIDYKNQISGD